MGAQDGAPAQSRAQRVVRQRHRKLALTGVKWKMPTSCVWLHRAAWAGGGRLEHGRRARARLAVSGRSRLGGLALQRRGQLERRQLDGGQLPPQGRKVGHAQVLQQQQQ